MNVSRGQKYTLVSQLIVAISALGLTVALTCSAFQNQAAASAATASTKNGQETVASASATAASNATTTPQQPPVGLQAPKVDGWEAFEVFRKSAIGIPPFEPDILMMPEQQLIFLRETLDSDLAFYREILREAIDRRNKWGASVALTFKYAAKLIARILRNRRNEQKINPRVEPKREFFGMIANLVELTLDNSGNIKKTLYNKKDLVDHEGLYNRFNDLVEYIKRIFNSSPVGPYLRWDKASLYRDNHTHPYHNRLLLDETSDLLAQFRALGYESSMFAGRRIVNLLRVFSRGATPTDIDVWCNTSFSVDRSSGDRRKINNNMTKMISQNHVYWERESTRNKTIDASTLWNLARLTGDLTNNHSLISNEWSGNGNSSLLANIINLPVNSRLH